MININQSYKQIIAPFQRKVYNIFQRLEIPVLKISNVISTQDYFTFYVYTSLSSKIRFIIYIKKFFLFYKYVIWGEVKCPACEKFYNKMKINNKKDLIKFIFFAENTIEKDLLCENCKLHISKLAAINRMEGISKMEDNLVE